MVVLGADPDAPVKDDWDEAPQVAYNPRTVGLVWYFGHHKYMKFSQRFDDFDRKILSGTFMKLLKRGYSKQDIETMVDVFWHTWGGDTDTPALAYVSRDMQDKLTTELTPTTESKYLNWLIYGMPNEGPLDDPSHIRKAVLLASTELTHRYPDVVASIISLDRGYRATQRLLSAASDVVLWNLGADTDIHAALDDLSKIELPLELRSTTRAPKSIRRKHERLAQAAANIPRKKTREVPGAA